MSPDTGPIEKKPDTTSWYRFESLIKPRQIVRVKGDKRQALTLLAASASRSLNLGADEHAEL